MQLELTLIFLKLFYKCINSGLTVLTVQGTTTDIILLLVQTIQERQKAHAKDILEYLVGRVVSQKIVVHFIPNGFMHQGISYDSHRPLAEVLSPCDKAE